MERPKLPMDDGTAQTAVGVPTPSRAARGSLLSSARDDEGRQPWSLRVAAARSSSAWAKRSNPYEQCERRRETVSSRHCATLTAGLWSEQWGASDCRRRLRFEPNCATKGKFTTAFIR